MNFFIEKNNDDLDLLLIDYTESYLRELTTMSMFDHPLTTIELSQKITAMEKNIINNHYKKYIQTVKINIKDPNIYQLHKIFFTFTNVILRMMMLYISNMNNYDKSVMDTKQDSIFHKREYLICILENYIDIIIEPLGPNLNKILNLNKIFKIENSTSYIKKFIELNNNSFSTKTKMYKLKKLLNYLDDSN